MKLKDLRGKDLGELKKLLKDTLADIPGEESKRVVKKDKNIKKLSNLRRQIAILLGMVSAREAAEKK